MSASCNTWQCRYQLAKSDAVAFRGVNLWSLYISRTRTRDAMRFEFKAVANRSAGEKEEASRVSRKEIANRLNETSAIIYLDKQVGSFKSDYRAA